MDVHVAGNAVHVYLSRRNLTHLLAMLDVNTGIQTLQRQCGTLRLKVAAEEDAAHYQGREPGPGFEREMKD